MNKKNVLVLLAVILLAGIVLSGCSSEEEISDSGSYQDFYADDDYSDAASYDTPAYTDAHAVAEKQRQMAKEAQDTYEEWHSDSLSDAVDY